MISVRSYTEKDAEIIGRLIADTYSRYNLSYLPLEERGPYLGPFQHAYSLEPAHKVAIADVIKAVVVLVAEYEGGEIVGVLRGKRGRLQSLFVRSDHHHKNVGRSLVDVFETWCLGQDCRVITLASSLYAVPFYQRLGYKKTTGVRRGHSFEGTEFLYQPMKKILLDPQEFSS